MSDPAAEPAPGGERTEAVAEEATSNPATTLSSDAHDTKELIELLPKLLLPASALVYVTGFAASVRHYAGAGVDIHALESTTFLAAGLLFLTANALSWALVRAVSKALRQEAGVGRKIATTLGVVWFFAFVSVNVGGLGLLIYIAGAWVLAYDFTGETFDPKLPSLVADPLLLWVRLVRFMIFAIPLFAWLVYPHTAPHFGGGRPLMIERLDPRESGTPAPLCNIPNKARRVAGCRALYKVHEADDRLYLAVEEYDTACDRISRWSNRATGTIGRCHVRVRSADFPVLRLFEE